MAAVRWLPSSASVGPKLLRVYDDLRGYMASYRDAILKMYNDRTAYDTEGGTRHPEDAERLVASSNIGLGDRVLDVATGTGLVAFAAAERIGKQGSVEAIDISKGLLEQARRKVTSRKGGNIRFRLADAEETDFASAAFDQIFCCEALVLFQDPLAVLRNWHRLLKPGGQIAFTSTHEDSYFGVHLQASVRTILGPNAPLQMHGLLGTEEKLRYELASAGFSCIRIFSELRGGYKPGNSVQCTRDFLSLLFKGAPSVVGLGDEELAQICDTFMKRVFETATPEGIWQSTGLFFVYALKGNSM